ncbi:MAG: S8 family serine peptidase, partial [Bryobacteraceae bacterium]
MNKRRLITLLLLLVTWINPASAEQRFIVRTSGGVTTVKNICLTIGCKVARGLDDPSSQLFLITTPDAVNPVAFRSLLLRQTGITNVEADLPVSVLEGDPFVSRSAPSLPAGLFDRAPASFYGSTVWNGYARQPAANIVRAYEAQNAFGVEGTSIVAVIDTGVDPLHPALRSVLVPGYDFTRDQAGMGSETADVSQSTAAVVDGTPPTRVNDSTVAVVNQSTAAVVDDPNHAAFGHGTIVAGIIHLVAPRAMIMP